MDGGGAPAARELLHAHERALTPLLAAATAARPSTRSRRLQVVRRRLRLLELRRAPERHAGAVLEVVAGVFPLLVREFGSPEERVAALSGRLEAVPALLAEARDALEPGLSAAAVDAGVDYAEGLVDLVGPTSRAFVRSVGHDGAVDAPSAAAVAALEAFRDHLRDVLAPTASGECAAGAAVVADVLHWEHCLDEPPQALAEYGREVLGETQRRYGQARRRSRLRGRGGRRRGGPGGRAGQGRTGGRLRARSGRGARLRRRPRHRRLPAGEELEVVATPAFLRSLLPFAAYDPPGPFADRQLGFYYVTPPPEGLDEDETVDLMRGHALTSLRTTGVHEAYPGHHLQLCSANRAPTLARRIAGAPDGGNILVEGWAFYCEELMDREGFLDDPAVRLMRLNDQIWRACRVVIDVELHLGRWAWTKRWTSSRARRG